MSSALLATNPGTLKSQLKGTERMRPWMKTVDRHPHLTTPCFKPLRTQCEPLDSSLTSCGKGSELGVPSYKELMGKEVRGQREISVEA